MPADIGNSVLRENGWYGKTIVPADQDGKKYSPFFSK